MSDRGSTEDADWWQVMSETASSFSEALAQLAQTLAERSSTISAQVHRSGPRALSERFEDPVRWLVKLQRERTRFFPRELVSDPVWNILLHLFRADLGREFVSVSDACRAADVPETTALRFITAMVEQGMILRQPDPRGGSQPIIELTENSREALSRYVGETFLHG